LPLWGNTSNEANIGLLHIVSGSVCNNQKCINSKQPGLLKDSLHKVKVRDRISGIDHDKSGRIFLWQRHNYLDIPMRDEF